MLAEPLDHEAGVDEGADHDLRVLLVAGLERQLGFRLEHPDVASLAVVGDGGFLFSVGELATAVKYGLGVVFLVLNDQRLGAIKFLQEALYGRWGEADLTNPDFPALAQAFGLEGQRVERLDDLPQALDKALGHRGPALLELPMAIDPPWEL